MNLYELCKYHGKYEKINNHYLQGLIKEKNKKILTIHRKRKLYSLRDKCPHEYIRVIYNKNNSKKAFFLQVCIACGKINELKSYKNLNYKEQDEVCKIVKKYFKKRYEGTFPDKEEIISNISHKELLKEVENLMDNYR